MLPCTALCLPRKGLHHTCLNPIASLHTIYPHIMACHLNEFALVQCTGFVARKSDVSRSELLCLCGHVARACICFASGIPIALTVFCCPRIAMLQTTRAGETDTDTVLWYAWTSASLAPPSHFGPRDLPATPLPILCARRHMHAIMHEIWPKITLLTTKRRLAHFFSAQEHARASPRYGSHVLRQ